MTIVPQDSSLSLRPAASVMRVSRMGHFFASRLSFMPQLLRRAKQEKWLFSREKFALDERGVGIAIYRAKIGEKIYSLLVFAHDLPDQSRNDRVTSTAWDATFNLIDGEVTAADIDRLEQHTPRQEEGRFSAKELVLSRANKSTRLFRYVAETLAHGEQPDIDRVKSTGYVMRTTAVYGSGKFGCADRRKIAHRPEFHIAFQVEMLAIYLFRWFSIDLVNHMAQVIGGSKATCLDPHIAVKLGIGNSTGLGMAPFLVRHHQLIHTWLSAKETALARVRKLQITPDIPAFFTLFDQACAHVAQWQVDDTIQSAKIATLQQELQLIRPQLTDLLTQGFPWNAVIECCQSYSLETQEFMVSMVLFPNGEVIDDLGETMQCQTQDCLQPGQTVTTLMAVLRQNYCWALEMDFDDPDQQYHLWYYSEEKVEPRRGCRYEDQITAAELPVKIAKDVHALWQQLQPYPPQTLVATVLADHPELRQIIRRVQAIEHFPYGEIRDNLLARDIRPVDILRAKLSFFGVTKFDPKSDLWLRVNMYQGYPLPSDLQNTDIDTPQFAYPIV